MKTTGTYGEGSVQNADIVLTLQVDQADLVITL